MKTYTDEPNPHKTHYSGQSPLVSDWALMLVDILLSTTVLLMAFLSISKSIGYAQSASYAEALFGSDKVLHLIAGGILPLFIVRCFFRLTLLSLPKRIFLAYLFASVILMVDEGLQYFNVHRYVSFEDLLAGFSGLALGAMVLCLLLFFRWVIRR